MRYHHILDPRTGMPASSGLASVTLMGESAMEMDALATAVFILGVEKGYPLLKSFVTESIFVSNDQEVFLSPGLKEGFAFIK